MFDIDGRKLELRFSLGKVEALERMMGGALLPIILSGSLMVPVATLKAILACGVKEVGGDALPNMEEAVKTAEKIILEYGMVDPMKEAVMALRRDCAFLFRVNS